ncbi:BTB/POZ domain-containing protein [Zea mays]|uniref:BTB/POZ domain-containing protein n=1 Tax=Zea mays TaxID=4577 RepID=A0A3L6DC47_MAIZE|nr:BTB/POZ domain-containing protein [Zea mays]
MSRKEAEPAGQDGSSSSATDGGGGSGSGRELADALARRRLYREVTLALHSGLRDAKADFSFLRARGLRSLLGFLRSTASAADDALLLLFRHSQSIPDLQVIPVLFQNSLHQPKQDPVVTLDHIFGTEPMKITSPPTDSEIALALRVLEVKLVEGYNFDDHTTSDVRVCFKLIDEQPEWFSCHSSVLSQNSKYFSDRLGQNDIRSNSCVEIECPRAQYDHYVKMLKLMYLPGESIVDSFDSVKSALGVLRASNSLGCELVTKGCIAYIEAVPWDDNEEEEILEVARSLGSDAVSLLARLHAPSADAVKNVFISAIRFATCMETLFPPFLDDLKTSAQEQTDFMIHEDDETALVMMDEDVRSVVQEGITKLLSGLRTGLDLLATEFDQSPDQAEKGILCSLADIDWDSKYSSGLWAVKAKLIEVTGKALDAVGYGTVVLPAPSRFHLLKTWLPYIQTTKRSLDGNSKGEMSLQMDSDMWQNVESAIVSMVLALPSDDQADILSEWMKNAEQFRYPDLTEAFECQLMFGSVRKVA